MNKTKIATLALCVAFGFSAHAQNLLLNGSFESPPIEADTIAIISPTSWDACCGNTAYRVLNGNYGVPEYAGPQDGHQYAAIGGGGSLSQSFNITTAGDYQLGWYDNAGDHPDPSPYTVTVSSGAGVMASTSLNASHFVQGWLSHSLQLNLSPGMYTLQFHSEGPVFGLATLLDNVSLQSSFADFLYFTERANPWPGHPKIMRVKTDGSGLEMVYQNATEGAEGGIALDVSRGHLYSGSEAWIFRLNLDGTGRVNLVPVTDQVQDVELDLAHGKIYWSEGGHERNAIRSANLDGTYARTFVDVGFFGTFTGLAVDPNRGKLYVTFYDVIGNTVIQVMNLDGSGQNLLYDVGGQVGVGTVAVNDLEIDLATGTLYFNLTDCPIPGIYKAPADGSGPIEIVIPTPDPGGGGIHYDPIDHKFYATYFTPNRWEIRSVNIDGTDVRAIAEYAATIYWYEVGHGIPVAGRADTEPPSITCPANINVSCSTDRLVTVTYPPAIVSDNSDPSPTVTYSIPSGSGFPVGTTKVTVTATDASGNHSSCSFTVTRAPLSFAGFLSPVGGADATGGSFAEPLRTFKLNSTIPLKFTASCGGSPVVDNIHTLQAVKWSSQTDSDPPIDATPTDAATTGNQFRLAGSEWRFNLDTKATAMSAGKWLLTATLSDGSQHSVWIQLK